MAAVHAVLMFVTGAVLAISTIAAAAGLTVSLGPTIALGPFGEVALLPLIVLATMLLAVLAATRSHNFSAFTAVGVASLWLIATLVILLLNPFEFSQPSFFDIG